jgi:hypothetical protein
MCGVSQWTALRSRDDWRSQLASTLFSSRSSDKLYVLQGIAHELLNVLPCLSWIQRHSRLNKLVLGHKGIGRIRRRMDFGADSMGLLCCRWRTTCDLTPLTGSVSLSSARCLHAAPAAITIESNPSSTIEDMLSYMAT